MWDGLMENFLLYGFSPVLWFYCSLSLVPYVYAAHLGENSRCSQRLGCAKNSMVFNILWVHEIFFFFPEWGPFVVGLG